MILVAYLWTLILTSFVNNKYNNLEGPEMFVGMKIQMGPFLGLHGI